MTMDVLEMASSCVRGVLTAAPGNVLICADFANIEGRIQCWFAQEKWKLEAFKAYDAGTGPDLYKLAYSRAFKVVLAAVTAAQRQVGKVCELSMGFGGGIAAYANMAGNYDIDLEDLPAMVLDAANGREMDSAEWCADKYLTNRRKTAKPGEAIMSFDAACACDVLKQRWRALHPAIVATWANVEDAAIATVRTGQAHTLGPVTFGMRGRWLHIRLPSGRLLSFFDPEIKPGDRGGEQLTFMGMGSEGKSTSKKWMRRRTYGGDTFQSVVQAIARGILTAGMLRVDAAGYLAVLTVHDEAAAEVAENFGSLEEYERLLSMQPEWAAGLPIAVEGWRGKNFRKG